MQMYEKCSDIVKMESFPLMNAMAVENVVENESHFSLKIVDQDLSSLAMFIKHLMGEQCKRVVRVGEGKVESMGGIGGGSSAKCSMVAKDGLRGDGFVVDGGRPPSKSRKDREDGGVENKSSLGSRLIVTGEVWISQKSQENSKKQASTDTRIRRVQKEAKESKPKPEKSSLSQTQSNIGQ
ncbi:hypothetical protein Tco_0898621 [Tanacetum coccineum]